MTPIRGEVWMFDCGMAEKVRPVLILSVPFATQTVRLSLLSFTRRLSAVLHLK